MALTDITGTFGPDAFTLAPSTGGVSQGFNRTSKLPPLTAEQQAALMGRRNIATRGAAQTERFIQRERARSEGDTIRKVGEVGRDQSRASRAGMNALAGRGTARGPMFVNPMQRQLAEDAQSRIGEYQSEFAATLANLENALRRAEIDRDREYNQINFDEATMRSDLRRLMGLF